MEPPQTVGRIRTSAWKVGQSSWNDGFLIHLKDEKDPDRLNHHKQTNSMKNPNIRQVGQSRQVEWNHIEQYEEKIQTSTR